jgi:hypothetical protein
VVLPTLNVRVDYLYPEPRRAGRFVWSSTGEISVHASLALIDEEARGQSLLFFSGIAAGLASGLVPLAVEVLTVGRRRHT